MVHTSNSLITILNMGTLGISIIVIIISVSYHDHTRTLCQEVLKRPLLLFGAFLFIMSSFALLGSCCGISALLWCYLFVLLLTIIALFCFSIFLFIVTNRGVGQVVSDRGFKEYRLDDYSGWLQRNVVNDENWDKIRSCLADSHVCAKLAARNASFDDFYKTTLSSTESGCCKPPTYCGYQFQNATFWVAPQAGQVVLDNDCKAWSNNQTELCFSCGSCRAGVLDNLKREWRTLSIINVCLIIFLNIVYAIGCCALDNNQIYAYHRYRGYP